MSLIWGNSGLSSSLVLGKQYVCSNVFNNILNQIKMSLVHSYIHGFSKYCMFNNVHPSSLVVHCCCVFAFVWVKTSESRLKRVRELLVKQHKYLSRSNSLTSLLAVFQSFSKVLDDRKKVHCFCSWLKAGGNVSWISSEGVCVCGKAQITLTATCRGSTHVWFPQGRIWQWDKRRQWAGGWVY